MDQEPTKAAIWARVSTTEQETENQIAQLENWAEGKNLQLVCTYQLQESAYRGRHKSLLEQVYLDAHQGRFQVLLIWALDRLSREGARATLEIFNRLNNAGVTVLSYQEPWTASSSPEMRELLLSITGWMAKMESQRLSERTKAGMEKARSEGKQIGRPVGSTDKKKRRNRGYLLRYAE